MTFALAGALITQTGTDTSLAGLAAIAGVTTKVEGAGAYIKTRYYLPVGTSLTYSILTFNPRFESLHFGNTACLLYPVNASSILTIGVQITQFGGTYTNMSEAITFGDNSGNAYQQTSGLRLTVGALFWYSGIIRLQTCTGIGTISYNNGGSEVAALTGYIGPNAVMEFMAVPSGQSNESCQVHIAAALSFVIDGLTVRSYGTAPPTGLVSITTSANYTTPPVFVMEGFGGISPQGNLRQSNFFTTYGLKLKACKKGLNWWLGSLVRGVNCSVGSAIPLMEHNVDLGHPQGYGEIRNEVDVTCKNSAGALLQNMRVYVRDTNNGDRKTYTAFSQNINNLADNVYFGSTDVNGNLKWLGNTASILLCAVSRPVTGTVVGIDDSGLNKKDIRSLTNAKGVDDFRFHYWGYLTQYLSSIEIVQSDKVPYRIVQAFLTDTDATLTEANAVAKLASSFTVAGNNLTVTANSTLDDVYDAMKAYKTRPVLAQVEYPSIGVQPVVAAGTALTTAMTVAVNAGVVLSGGTKFKSLASGGVTITGAALSGLTITGNVTQATPTNLTGVTITGTLTYNTATPITITFTNVTAGTVSNSGTALVTVERINSTLTAGTNVAAVTNITLTLTGLQTGSDIVILQAGTPNILLAIDSNVGTSYAYVYQTAQSVDIGVIKPGFVPRYERNFSLAATSAALPISQTADRNFV